MGKIIGNITWCVCLTNNITSCFRWDCLDTLTICTSLTTTICISFSTTGDSYTLSTISSTIRRNQFALLICCPIQTLAWFVWETSTFGSISVDISLNPKTWTIISYNASSSNSCSFTICHLSTFSIQTNCTIGSDLITSCMCCTWEVLAFFWSTFISIPLTIDSINISLTSSFYSWSRTSTFLYTSTIFLGSTWPRWWSEIWFTLVFSC